MPCCCVTNSEASLASSSKGTVCFVAMRVFCVAVWNDFVKGRSSAREAVCIGANPSITRQEVSSASDGPGLFSLAAIQRTDLAFGGIIGR
jgi:hypothetical protein